MAHEMATFFLDAEKDGFKDQTWHTCSETDGEHGRIEVRQTWTTLELGWFESKSQWEGLKTLAVQRTLRIIGDKEERALRLLISSCPAEDVQRLARLSRGHWSVENQLHWVLDMVFGEDQSRTRKDNAPLNLATTRRLALGLLKRNKTCKVGVVGKRLLAASSRAYPIDVLTGK